MLETSDEKPEDSHVQEIIAQVVSTVVELNEGVRPVKPLETVVEDRKKNKFSFNPFNLLKSVYTAKKSPSDQVPPSSPSDEDTSPPISPSENIMDSSISKEDFQRNKLSPELAAAAAAMKQEYAVNHQFTSNASTSSIHNDLKMILEESKENSQTSSVSSPSSSNSSPAEQTRTIPKTEKAKKREIEQKTVKEELAAIPKIEHKQKESNKKNTVPWQQKQKSQPKIQPQTNKIDDSDLVRMMKNMMENNGKNPDGTQKHYSYSKDVLLKIRQQRANFVEQIFPDIFKSYFYCMNGKYWDPEKYFDIVQYSDDFEKIPHNTSWKNNYRRPSSPSMNQISKAAVRKAFTHNRNKAMSESSSMMMPPPPPPPVEATQLLCESPHALIVPRNSPKDIYAAKQQTHYKKHSNYKKMEVISGNTSHSSINTSATESISSTNPQKNNCFNESSDAILEVSTVSNVSSVEARNNDVDKLLLDLIKNKENSNQVGKVNVLDLINNKKKSIPKKNHHKKHPQAATTVSILESLLNHPEQSEKPKPDTAMRPKLLTAQEFEMSQFNEQKRLASAAAEAKLSMSLHQAANVWTKLKLEEQKQRETLQRNGIMNCSAQSDRSDSTIPETLRSDAYRQLVHNLDNHPLNAPAVNSTNPINELMKQLKIVNTVAPVESLANVNEESSNVLRQMLNLDVTKPVKKAAKQPNKNKPKMTKSKSNQQSLTEENSKFQYFFSGQNRDNIETAVNNALNQVINKQVSPTAPKSPKNKKTPQPEAELNYLLQKLSSPEICQEQLKKNVADIENEHFNSLLSKIMPPKVEREPEPVDSSNILKWFTSNGQFNGSTRVNLINSKSNFSPTALNEIEFMENYRPNKLY